MSKLVPLGAKVPLEVLEAVDSLARRRRTSRSAIVLELIQVGLGKPGFTNGSDEYTNETELVLQQRYTEITERLTELTQRVERLEQGNQTAVPVPAATPEGLTLQEVCSQHGISFKNLSRNSKAKHQSVLEYLRDQTGVQWVQRGKRYCSP